MGRIEKKSQLAQDFEQIENYFQRMKAMEIMGRAFGGRNEEVDGYTKIQKTIAEPLVGVMERIEQKMFNQEESKHLQALNAINANLENLNKPKEGEVPAGPQTFAEKLAEIKEMTTNAETLLKEKGYTVEPAFVSAHNLADAIAEANPDRLRAALEKAGLQVTGGPVPYDKYQQDITEAIERSKKEGREDKSIEAVTSVVNNLGGQFIEQVFGPLVRAAMEAPINTVATEAAEQVNAQAQAEAQAQAAAQAQATEETQEAEVIPRDQGE